MHIIQIYPYFYYLYKSIRHLDGLMTTYTLPLEGYIRLKHILGDNDANIPPLIPISNSSWWAGIKSGKYPQPVKLGPRTTAWRMSDIRQYLENPENFGGPI